MNNMKHRPRIHQTLWYALIGAAFGFTFPVIGTGLQVLFSGQPLTPANMLQAQNDFPLLWVVDTAPVVIALLAGYAGLKQDALENINAQLRANEIELKEYQTSLEERVKERTAQLEEANRANERRNAQLESIARIARGINSIQRMEELLPHTARAISEQFGFYHTAIFLLDQAGEYALLTAASSPGGQRMLQRSHKLKVGTDGIVGFVAQNGLPRIALDIDDNGDPDLPQTRSEIALPLRGGNIVFGVLNVHSAEPNAFNDEDINVLSILADQVSVAIQNARSYEKLQEALTQAEAVSAQRSREQWNQLQSSAMPQGYYFDGIEARKIEDAKAEYASVFSVPLTLRGVRIGVLRLNSPDPSREWSEDEKDMARAAAEKSSSGMAVITPDSASSTVTCGAPCPNAPVPSVSAAIR
jgi:GAF domain-containing protein